MNNLERKYQLWLPILINCEIIKETKKETKEKRMTRSSAHELCERISEEG